MRRSRRFARKDVVTETCCNGSATAIAFRGLPPKKPWILLGWTGTTRPRYRPAFASPRARARVAQLVEHATENRSVGGSTPSPGTIFYIVFGTTRMRGNPLVSSLRLVRSETRRMVEALPFGTRSRILGEPAERSLCLLVRSWPARPPSTPVLDEGLDPRGAHAHKAARCATVNLPFAAKDHVHALRGFERRRRRERLGVLSPALQPRSNR